MTLPINNHTPKLGSLKIENYRNLESLTIPALGNVNLFMGKNNVGKTALLEAISIYASQGDPAWILELLKRRGLDFNLNRSFLTSSNSNNDELETVIKGFLDIYTDKKYLGKSLLVGENNSENVIRVRFTESDQDSAQLSLDEQYLDDAAQYGALDLVYTVDKGNIHAQSDKKIFQIPLRHVFRHSSLMRIFKENNIVMPFNFVKTHEIQTEDNARKYDSILLTNIDFEPYILDALKIVEPKVSRLMFIGDSRSRQAMVSVGEKFLPLKSMGDGINRILTIILALIDAKNGFLLIDEFENGLHYSVQTKLWEVIFKVAQRLNVQVFVTTHSSDCFQSFVKVKAQQTDVMAKCFRLENVNNKITAKWFTDETLKSALLLDGDLR